MSMLDGPMRDWRPEESPEAQDAIAGVVGEMTQEQAAVQESLNVKSVAEHMEDAGGDFVTDSRVIAAARVTPPGLVQRDDLVYRDELTRLRARADYEEANAPVDNGTVGDQTTFEDVEFPTPVDCTGEEFLFTLTLFPVLQGNVVIG